MGLSSLGLCLNLGLFFLYFLTKFSILFHLLGFSHSKLDPFFRYTVWSQLSADWTEVGSLLQSEEQLADFDRVGRKLFGPIVQSLGWDVLEVGFISTLVFCHFLVVPLLQFTFFPNFYLAFVHFKGESHLQAMLRPLVLQRLGGSGHKETIEEAKKRFSNLQVDPK